MDVRMWSKDFITEFINLYRSSPCLWKVKSTNYKDRFLRHQAYNKIARYCRKNGFPQANRDFVFKKIQSLRGSFRKELNKARDRANYTPSLWYYDLLLFTKDQELLTESVSNNTAKVNKQQHTGDDIKKEVEEDHDPTTPSLTHAIEINAVNPIAMDARMRSKDFITEFINLYRASPCLWKVKSPDYKDLFLRHQAYNKIVRYCRRNGFPQANKDIVFKKIQSLRASFRKELNKARDRPNYTPSLWYYDLLLFTKDQELLTESLSNNAAKVNKQQHTGDDIKKEVEEDHDSTTPNVTHAIEINAEDSEEDNKSYIQAEEETQSINRQPRTPKQFQLELQANQTDPLENHAACGTYKISETEFDVWARSIAMQLNNMDTSRALSLQLQIQTLVSNERLAFESGKTGHDSSEQW